MDENFNSNQLCQYIRDTISMSTMLGRSSMDAIKVINNCRNFCEIKRYHDRLSSKLDDLVPESDVIFEPTTLKGTKFIIPILSLLELRKEGRDLKHCIRSYQYQISEGTYAAFKVMKPERATLGIDINECGKYSIDQIQGLSNDTVSKETIDYIGKWFVYAKQLS